MNIIDANYEKLEFSHYVRLANADEYWCDFTKNKVDDYISKFGDNFCFIIYRNLSEDDDYFAIPWSEGSVEIFSEKNIELNINPEIENARNRWHFTITLNNGRYYLNFHGNSDQNYDVTQYHNNSEYLPELNQNLPFKSKFVSGAVLNNNDLYKYFKCGNTGGMRRSNETNTLCLISDHTKSIYDDKWVGDEIHYTGMGTEGDQSLEFMQNKTLNESRDNGVNVHFFEVFKKNNYIYRGEVELSGDPYTESQIDEEGALRTVYMFPLKIKSTYKPSILSKDELEKFDILKQRKVRKFSNEKIKALAENSSRKPSYRNTSGNQYIRNPYVSEYAKRRANGICQLCEENAPFVNNNGEPYLETHHIVWLSQNGDDSIDNTVALCPNCHRKMHILDSDDDIKKLKSAIAEIED